MQYLLQSTLYQSNKLYFPQNIMQKFNSSLSLPVTTEQGTLDVRIKEPKG